MSGNAPTVNVLRCSPCKSNITTAPLSCFIGADTATAIKSFFAATLFTEP